MHYVYIRFRPLVPRGLQRWQAPLSGCQHQRNLPKGRKRRAVGPPQRARRRTTITYDALRLYSLSPACSSQATARQAPLGGCHHQRNLLKGRKRRAVGPRQRPGGGPR